MRRHSGIKSRLLCQAYLNWIIKYKGTLSPDLAMTKRSGHSWKRSDEAIWQVKKNKSQPLDELNILIITIIL